MFDERKYVEAFMAADIERELGLRRVDLVSLALLLGSDYTEGVRGVGIVNATEVVRAFPSPSPPAGAEGEGQGGQEGPETGLERFKRWLDGFDPLGELQGGGEAAREAWVDEKVAAFHRKHRSARTRWVVSDRFPDPAVFRAFLHPQVNGATDAFTWQLPDLDRIRGFTGKKLGWPVADTDAHLLPMLRRMQERSVQTRMDSYYRAYEDNVTFARIKSKRLRAAVAQLTGQAEEELPNAVQDGEDGEEDGGDGEEEEGGGVGGAKGRKKGKARAAGKAKGKGKGKEKAKGDAGAAGGEGGKGRKRRLKTKNGRRASFASLSSSSSSSSEEEEGGAEGEGAGAGAGNENGAAAAAQPEGASKRPRRAAAERRRVVVDEEEEGSEEEGEQMSE